MKWYLHPVALFFGVVITLMLGAWGFNWYEHRGDKTPFDQKADSAHKAVVHDSIIVYQTDTVYGRAQTKYLTIRDKNANVPQAHEVGVACDSALAAEDRRVAARDTLIGALRREVVVWQEKPGPPRIQAYAEGLYDVAHRVPVARAGATFKMVGPISLSAAGEYAAPQVGKSDPAFRVTAGLRYDF
jgi:hypothetical protein